MPHRFRREVERIMSGSTADPVSDLREIAAEIEELIVGAEAGDYKRLADLLRMALDEAQRQAAPDTARLVENQVASVGSDRSHRPIRRAP